MSNAIEITGKTYPVRRELRRAGCVWNYDHKAYYAAIDNATARNAAETAELDIEEVETDPDNFTTATGDKLRDIRQDSKDRKAARMIERAESKEKQADEYVNRYKVYTSDYSFITEPIKIGHHSEKRHRKLRDRISGWMDKEMELRTEAKKLRESAAWLFPARVKGDAERERQAKRDAASSEISKGDLVSDSTFGVGVVTRINKKSFCIHYEERGFSQTIDKSWVKLVEKRDPVEKVYKFKAGDKVIATRLLAKYEGVIKRRTSRGYSVEYESFGTCRDTFAECSLELA